MVGKPDRIISCVYPCGHQAAQPGSFKLGNAWLVDKILKTRGEKNSSKRLEEYLTGVKYMFFITPQIRSS
jgi:hypothetical protein